MSAATPAKETFLERFPLVSFFFLSYLFAWAVWIPTGLLAPETRLLVLPGVWAPTIAALLVTALTEGRAGVRKLLRGLTKWRVRAGDYLLAIFGVLVLGLLAVGLHVLVGGSLPDIPALIARLDLEEARTLWLIIFVPALFLLTILVAGPLAEELGWRGYAQPRLQARTSPGLAGLAIGLAWSLWHLPLFYFFPSAVGGLPFTHYGPLLCAMGVLFAWIYNRTGGSVLLCILFHAGFNLTLGALVTGMLSRDQRLLTFFVLLVVVSAVTLYPRIRPVQDSA